MHRHHHSEESSGRKKIKLSKLVKLCVPLVEFIEVDRKRSLKEIYRVLDSGSRLNVLLQRLMEVYLNTGFEVHHDLRRSPMPRSEMINAIYKLNGEELLDHLQLLLAAVAMKIVELPDDQLDAIEKLAGMNKYENCESVDDIMNDWEESAVMLQKLQEAEKPHHSHKSHKEDKKHHHHHSLFSHRRHLDPIEDAQLHDPANGSNTFPRHGLSV